MKGISPFVATVLLIAFTIGIGGIVSVWLTGFTQTSTGIIRKEGEHQVICSNGALDVSNLRYCNNNISGIIKNNGRITLGNITVQIVFANSSLISYSLNDTSGTYLVLKAGQISTFNQSIGPNYDRIWIYSNCSSVTDEAVSSDVTASC